MGDVDSSSVETVDISIISTFDCSEGANTLYTEDGTKVGSW